MTKKKEQPEVLMTAKQEVIETNETMKYGDMFILVRKDNEVRIACTNKIVSSKVFNSFKEAQKYIDEKPWELIVNTTIVIYDISKEIINETKQN